MTNKGNINTYKIIIEHNFDWNFGHVSRIGKLFCIFPLVIELCILLLFLFFRFRVVWLGNRDRKNLPINRQITHRRSLAAKIENFKTFRKFSWYYIQSIQQQPHPQSMPSWYWVHDNLPINPWSLTSMVSRFPHTMIPHLLN